MRRQGTAALAAALSVAAAPVGADAAPPATSAPTQPAALAAAPKAPKRAPVTTAAQARALIAETTRLPRGAGRTRLVGLARRISVQQATNPCAAITTIERYRTTIKRLPKREAKRALSIDARALKLNQRLLASKRAARCGGGIAPAGVSTATPSVLRSDATGVSLKVNLPEVGVGTKSKGGRLWTELGAQGTDAPQLPGQPAIPTASFTIAVPEGAQLDTVASAGEGYDLSAVELLPAQPDAVDATSLEPRPNFRSGAYMDAKFVPPGDAYKTDVFPAKPADAAIVGDSRGLRLATIQVPLATYQPKRKRLRIHRSVNVNVAFKGGSTFGGDGGPWDKFGMSIAGGLVNAAVVREQWTRFPFKPRPCGEEFLIVTSATTRPAADALRAARTSAGILTRVVQTGAGAGEIGTTSDQIRDYIRGQLSSRLCVRPSYVVLLGNEELVPTYEISGATSDLPYATKDDADTLPDLAAGRIPGKDLAEVQTAIDKIIAYGTTPLPGGARSRAMVAAQFQDDDGDGREDRTFIQFAETVSQGLEARGVNVSRVYGEEPHGNPTTFNDGTPLPASLLKPGFGWNGTGAQVSTALNGNVFMAIHRDHGWSSGWGTPGYTSADIDALTNTALPVMLSINCSSGAYDRNDASLATRALVRPNGGAVAVFGDTEDSPSWHNTQLAFGFVDALLPSVLPGEGPAERQRLGDALTWGKLRLNGLAPAAGDGNTRFEHRIWHLFGDPTMYMRGGSSLRFDLGALATQFVYVNAKPGPPPEEREPNYLVRLKGLPATLTGQSIALLKGGEVVGQALVGGDGTAELPAVFGDGSVRPGDLKVVIDGPSDDPAVTVPVDSQKGTTSLTQQCPASVLLGGTMKVSGQLLGVPAGQTVNVTLDPPDSVVANAATPAIVKTAETDASGNWSVELTPTQSQLGQWTVQSSYAGDDAHEGSQSTSCAVSVERSQLAIVR